LFLFPVKGISGLDCGKRCRTCHGSTRNGIGKMSIRVAQVGHAVMGEALRPKACPYLDTDDQDDDAQEGEGGMTIGHKFGSTSVGSADHGT
jgi:hypothetical protein